MTYMHGLHRFKPPKQKRFLLLTLALVITLGGGIAWILSILGILLTAWSSLIGAFFAVFSVVIALLPYTREHTALAAQSTAPAPSLLPQAGSPPSVTPEQRGTLQIKTNRKLRGTIVYLTCGFDQCNLQPEMALPVGVQKIGYGWVGLVRFPSLEPGNYTAYTSSRKHIAKVTILAGLQTEMDWR